MSDANESREVTICFQTWNTAHWQTLWESRTKEQIVRCSHTKFAPGAFAYWNGGRFMVNRNEVTLDNRVLLDAWETRQAVVVHVIAPAVDAAEPPQTRFQVYMRGCRGTGCEDCRVEDRIGREVAQKPYERPNRLREGAPASPDAAQERAEGGQTGADVENHGLHGEQVETVFLDEATRYDTFFEEMLENMMRADFAGFVKQVSEVYVKMSPHYSQETAEGGQTGEGVENRAWLGKLPKSVSQSESEASLLHFGVQGAFDHTVGLLAMELLEALKEVGGGPDGELCYCPDDHALLEHDEFCKRIVALVRKCPG